MRKVKNKGAHSTGLKIRRMLCVALAAVMIMTTGLDAPAADTPADGQTVTTAEAIPDISVSSIAAQESLNGGIALSSRDSGLTLLASGSAISSALYNSGGKYITNVISGITYDSVLGWLEQHRNDSYYLGTPYPETSTGALIRGRNGGTDYRNPNGDKSGQNGYDDIAGQAMMNCTGFVWHVLYKASGKSYTDAYNSIPCWGGVGASNWRTFLRNNKVEYKTYYTNNANDLNSLISAVINDGYIASGDIIWTWDSSVGMMSDGLPSSTSGNHHIGIYTGTYFGGNETEWWDSIGYSPYTSTYYNTNLRSTVTPKTWCYAITVIKLGDSKGSAKVVKSSGNSSSTSNNSYYSLAGAKYGVYSGSTLVATLTTDSSGNSQTVSLEPGTYTVKEISASKGFNLDTNTYTINVTAGNTSVVRSTEPMQTGSLTIYKYSKDSSTTIGNSNYDLSGAVFGLYTNSACSGTAYKTVTLGDEANNNSSCTVSGLPFGTYYIKEITPPTGYLLTAPTIQAVTVNSPTTAAIAKVGYYNPPIMVTVKLVKKTDTGGIAMMVPSGDQGVYTEAGEAVKQAEISYHDDYTLEGATYGLYKTSEDAENGTNVIGTAKTDADGEAAFPKTVAMGTYYVKEITAPEGYMLDSTVYTVNATSPSVTASNTEAEVSAKDKPVSGKVIVYKYSGDPSVTEAYPEYYSMDGAEYTVYYDEACGEVAGILTIKDGVGELDGVLYGDVWIRETKAPQAEIDGVMTDMYEIDETVYKRTIGEETQTVTVNSTDTPVLRTLYVHKGPMAMLENGTGFTQDIPSTATSVVFTTSKTIPAEATSSNRLTDVSFAQNRGIMAWLEGTTWYVQAADGGTIYLNYDSSLMFAEKYSPYSYSTSSGERSTYGGHKLASVDFGSGVIDTSYVTDMSYMFRDCEKLSSITGFNQFDTSNVTNMMWMFAHCESLSGTLDLSGFDTSNVTDMSYMFAMCTGLAAITVNSTTWDTSGVTGFEGMFYDVWGMNSTALQAMVDAMEITASSSKSVNMANMFKQEPCSAYLSLGKAHGTLKTTELNFVNWDFSGVTTMNQMFSGFDSVQYFHYVVIGENVTDTANMFLNCYAFGSVGTAYVRLESSKVVSYGGMFTRANANSSGSVLYLQYTNGNYNLAYNMVMNTRSSEYVKVGSLVAVSANTGSDTLTASAAAGTAPVRSAIRSAVSGMGTTAAAAIGSTGRLFLKLPQKLGLVTEAQAADEDTYPNITNAVYSAYTDKDFTDKYGDFAFDHLDTDENTGEETAIYALSDVPYGLALYVKETVPGSGLGLDEDTWLFAGDAADGEYISSTDPGTIDLQGYISLSKTLDMDSAIYIAGNADYSLEGIKYYIYTDEACTAKLILDGAEAVFELNEHGQAETAGPITLQEGKTSVYYIKEDADSVPAGIKADTETYPVSLTGGSADSNVYLQMEDETAPPGKISVKKVSSTAVAGDGYSYAAEFTVYTDEACTNRYATILTDADTAVGTLEDVPSGTYYIKETQAPTGFELSDDVFRAVLTVNASKTAMVTAYSKRNSSGGYDSVPGAVLTAEDSPIYGMLHVQKISDNTFITEDKDNYSLANAVFGVYASMADAKADIAEPDGTGTKGIAYLVTDADGKASLGDLELGTYYVKETKAPEGYEIDTTGGPDGNGIYPAPLKDNGSDSEISYTVAVSDVPATVTIAIQKSSADTDSTDGNAAYSLENAVFGIYSAYTDGELTGAVETILTDADGKAESGDLAVGSTYYIVEEQAPEGFLPDDTVYKAVISGEGEVTYTAADTGAAADTVRAAAGVALSVAEDVRYMKLRVYKESDNRELTDDLDNYSLEGAVYGVYKSEADAQNDTTGSDGIGTKGLAYLTTDEDGYTEYTSDIPYGTYYIKETLSPDGFRMDEKIYAVEVTETTEEATYVDANGDTADAAVVYDTGNSGTQEAAVTLSVQDSPAYDSVILKILKESAQENSAGSLEGAQFLIQYYDGDYSSREDLENVSAKKYWTIETKKSGNEYLAELTEEYLTEGSSGLYYDSDGNVILPVGTYVIYEYAAPELYSTQGDWYVSDREILKQEETVSRAAVTYDGDVVTRTETDSTIILRVKQDEEGNSRIEATACDENSEWTVTLEPDGSGVVTLTKEDMALGSITIEKTDENGNPLTGVTYTLYKVYGLEDESYEEIRSGTTDGTGTVLFEELEYGTYRIEETKTPDGYTLLGEPILVTIPYETTVEEAEKMGADMDEAIYSSTGNTCCFVNLTYRITDTHVFALPTAGADPKIPVTLAIGLAVLAIGLFAAFRRKRAVKR